MKLAVQWTTDPPRDYQEMDSRSWSRTRKRPVPVGGEVIDGIEGWVFCLNVQGVLFTGYDHYAVEDTIIGDEEGIRVTVWTSDPEDYGPEYPGGLDQWADAMVWTFLPMTVDPTVDPSGPDRGYNTRQSVMRFAAPALFERESGKEIVNHRLSRWQFFRPPGDDLIRHGIWVPGEKDAVRKAYTLARRERGYREWHPHADVRAQAARSPHVYGEWRVVRHPWGVEAL